MNISSEARSRIAEAMRIDDKRALDMAVKHWLAVVLSDAKSTENATKKGRYYRHCNDIT